MSATHETLPDGATAPFFTGWRWDGRSGAWKEVCQADAKWKCWAILLDTGERGPMKVLSHGKYPDGHSIE